MDCLFCNISEERVIAQNELAYAVDTVARLNYRSLVLPTIELALGGTNGEANASGQDPTLPTGPTCTTNSDCTSWNYNATSGGFAQ